MAGPVSYGQVTLKRGMTANFELWDWFDSRLVIRACAPARKSLFFQLTASPSVRAFLLKRCLPVKLKAPGLNAKDGMVAIEEFQLAYEAMQLKKPAA